MNSGILPAISPHRARNLSLKHLEAWSETGSSHRRELDLVLKGIIRSLHNSTSPSKTLSAAMKKLNAFFSRSEVRGNVTLINNRHIKFRLGFPKAERRDMVFCSMQGEINSRTGAVNFHLSRPIKISLHALQRLIERLDDQSDRAVLNEIYSSTAHAVHWHKGATALNAKCWPVLSQNGFFVGVSDEGSSTTTLITWMKASGEKMGRKWGLPLNNLLNLRETCPERFEDPEFAQEFIRSFPWMLHEHVPGEDVIAIAWERREESTNEMDEDEKKWEEYQADNESHEPKLPTKLSTSYIAGFNYKAEPPPFKTHSLHKGVVVQKRPNGQLIVGLRNGWVGVVPLQSLNRGIQLIAGYEPAKIGEDIDVFVHKVWYQAEEQAYAVSLDPKDVAEANWIEIQKLNPVGAEATATLLLKSNYEYFAQLDSGLRGVIPAAEVKEKMHQPELYACSPIGTKWTVEVVGYRSEKKCLLLSLRNIALGQKLTPVSMSYLIGDQVIGTCVRRETNYAMIALADGMRGILHLMNNWGNELPQINSKISVTVISFDYESGLIQLAGASPHGTAKAFYAIADSGEHWIDFSDKYRIGDVMEAQVLLWQEKSACFLVTTIEGIVGRLPASEVDWLSATIEQVKLLIKPGDFLNLKILKLNQKSKKLVFSKKALEENLALERMRTIDTTCCINGTVISVLDYGCFIQLQPYGIQGLLHRTEIPEGRAFAKGDRVDVFIKEIDLSRNRLSLSFSRQMLTPTT